MRPALMEAMRGFRNIPFLRRGQKLAGVCAFVAVIYFMTEWFVIQSASDTVQTAKRMLAKSDMEAVHSTLRWLLWFAPDHEEALLVKAQAYEKQHQFDLASECYFRMPKDAPGHEAGHLRFSIRLINTGQLSWAERELVQHLKWYPSSKEARRQLWWLYNNQLRHREILELYENALQQWPGDLPILLALLGNEFQQRVAVESLSFLKKVRQVAPNEFLAILALGDCYWQLGNIAEARLLFEKALNARPDDVRARLLIAGFLLEQGRFDEAQNLLSGPGHLRKALTKDDRFWALQSKLAEVKGDNGEALRLLNYALEIRPNDRYYLNRKAQYLRQIGKLEDASELSARVADLTKIAHMFRELSGELQRRTPTAGECQAIADGYRMLGKLFIAENWEQLSRNLEKRK